MSPGAYVAPSLSGGPPGRPEKDGKRVRPTDLAGILRTLGLGKRTGTLKVSGDEGQIKYLYFKRGSLELLKTPRAKTLLGKALVKCRKLSPEELRKALNEQTKSPGEKLGHVVRRLGLADAEDVREALAFQVAEEAFDLFTWPRVRGEFIRGDPPLDIFDPDDLAEPVSINPMELAQEAEQRTERWEEISQVVPSLHDVYSPTPEAKEYQSGHPAGPESEALKHADGVRDVTEMLEQLPLTDNDALHAISKLVQKGILVPLSPLQLFGIAEACEHDRQLAKALRLYSRAEELGLDRPDLAERMGRVHLALGDIDRAVARYLQHAEQAIADERFDAAVDTLTRVVEIAPEREDVRESLVKALLATARGDEAVAQYEKLAEFYAQGDDPEKRLHALQEIAKLDPSHIGARGEIAAIYIGRGEVGFAIPELEELTAEYLQRGELDEAIAIMEKILELDPECLSANMQLATTLTRMGRVAEAIEQYLTFAASLASGGRVTDHTMATLTGIYEKIVELDPDRTEAREWLAKAYIEKDEIAKAISHYEEKARSLRAERNSEELAKTLLRIRELAPERTDTARELARTLGELDRRDEAARTFHEIAKAAIKRKEYAEALAIYEEVLLQNPFDLDAHNGIADLRLLEKEHERAARKFMSIGEMCFAVGLYEHAEVAFRKALELEPERADLRVRLADSAERLGRAEEAARDLVRAAKFFINDEENFGLAKKALRRARKLNPSNEDALDLMDTLQRRRQTGRHARYDEPTGRSSRPAGPTVPVASSSGSGGTVAPTITGGAREQSVPTIYKPSGSDGAKVMSIAERLRGLKLGTPNRPGSFAEGGEAHKSEAGLSGLAKLRAMKESNAEPETSKATTAKTMSALGKLRELSSGGPKADEGSVSKAGLSDLSRLERLKNEGGEGAMSSRGLSKVEERDGDDSGSLSTRGLSRVAERDGADAGAVSTRGLSDLDRLEAMGGDDSGSVSTRGLSSYEAGEAGVVDDAGAISSRGLSRLDEGEVADGDDSGSVSARGLSRVKSRDGDDSGSVSSRGLSNLEREGGAGDDSGSVSARGLSKVKSRDGDDSGSVSSRGLSSLEREGGAGDDSGSISKAGLSKIETRDGSDQGTISKVKLPKKKKRNDDGDSSSATKTTMSALGKLKALSGGGGGGGDDSGKLAAAGQVSAGPEGAGSAAPKSSTKKTLGALGRLKALKSGGGGSGGGDDSGKLAAAGQVSAGPEGAGSAAPEASKQKTLGALGRLKALKNASAGGGGGDDSGKLAAAGPATAGPEAAGEATSKKSAKKTMGALGKLKALGSLGDQSAGAAKVKPVSDANTDGDGEEKKEKPALPKSGLDGLKALASGGLSGGSSGSSGSSGGSAEADAAAALAAALAATESAVMIDPATGKPVGSDSEPEADASASEDATTSESEAEPEKEETHSAAFRIMSVAGVSDGDEAPPAEDAGEEEKAAPKPKKKKAMSALDRLKALRGGGPKTDEPPDPSDESVSKGPEAAGEATSKKSAKKTMSALGKLRSLHKKK